MLGDRTSMVFGGTVATFGRGKAVVVATGMDTEIGRIAGNDPGFPGPDERLSSSRSIASAASWDLPSS